MSRSRCGFALVQARGGKFGDKVYLCANGKRHYVPSVDRLKHYGFKWPQDLQQVSDEVLMAFQIGGWLPEILPHENIKSDSIKSSMTMREYVAAQLKGIGLEVGAATSPFPVPIGCKVLYGDRIPHEQLVASLYPGQVEFELVRSDLITDFGDFNGIADQSLDFIIGCHVIEHVFDPIGTLINAYRALRLGGMLVLVIPDRDRTFDRRRPLTELDHLLIDHEQPDPQRDYGHYEEFYRLAFKTPSDQLRSKVEHQFRCRGDLHVHVWNYQTFMEMIAYVNKNFVRWSNIWSHQTLSDEKNDIEFYFTLTK